MKKQVLVKSPKTQYILSDKDFLKHGFKKDADYVDLKAYVSVKLNKNYRILYTKNNVLSMDVTWIDQNDLGNIILTTCISGTRILKKTDLGFLLTRCTKFT